MRILLAGDCHGNLKHVEYLFAKALDNEINTIIQLGDFGYWPHHDDFAGQVDKLAVRNKIDFFWLDGNHENFDALEKAVDVNSDLPQVMGERLYYLPRGSVHDFGVKVLILGGAYSIDKRWRTEGSSWWSQETITPTQAEKAMSHGHVPIMLSHDMPEEAYHVQFRASGYKDDVSSQSNRFKISRVVDKVKPKLLVHGHMHTRYEQYIAPTHVVGLAHDGDWVMTNSWWILDTDEYLE